MSDTSKTSRRFQLMVSNLSIRSKVTWTTLSVSFIALLLASAVVLTIGWISSRTTLLIDTRAQVNMLSDNCGAALAFDDATDAAELLNAFSAMPHVRLAAVYRKDGTLLAGYRPGGVGPIPERPRLSDGHRFSGTTLDIAKPVMLNGDVAGTVFLSSDLSPVYDFLRILLLTLAAALVLASVVIIALTSWLQKFVSMPVVRLAAVARKVSETEDFSIRADRETDDEIGLLTDTFNQTMEAVVKSNQALVTSERNYREIFNGMSDAIIIVDPVNGDIIDVNDALLTMFGYDKSEFDILSYERLSSNVPPYTEKDAMTQIRQTQEKGSHVFEWHSRHKSGVLFWTEVALRIANIGGVPRIVAVVRNIDERKTIEAQLRQAQKMEAIGTLAGGIAHDFNNILQAIVGNTELALLVIGEQSSAVNFLNNIDNASRRATDIVSQILSLSRQGDLEVKTIQPHIIVKETLKLLRASIPKTIAFDQKINSQSYVSADPSRLHQVLMNLCTNAYHAMQADGGTLRVALEDTVLSPDSPEVTGENGIAPGTYVKLTIRDTGHGIPDDIIKHIFDPYFTTKEKGKGTGLGLSVVNGIVKSMKGCISVASRVNEGTTFTLCFPTAQPADEAQTADVNTLTGGTERVLVIDDEPSISTICGSILERLGYHPTIVNEAPGGLATFLANPKYFDIIITDMTMPSMTGVELAKEIKAVRPEIPIILTTGYSEALTPEILNSTLFSTVMMKPYSIQQIADTVRSLLHPPDLAADPSAHATKKHPTTVSVSSK